MNKSHAVDWRRRLRRDIGWLLLAKLIGLILLRSLFFSHEQRVRVDEPALAGQLALEQPSLSPQAGAASTAGKNHDRSGSR